MAQRGQGGRDSGRDGGDPRRRAGGAGGRPRRGGAPGAATGAPDGAVWLFGLHAVRAALENPRREKRRLLATPNALRKLAAAPAEGEAAETEAEPEAGAAAAESGLETGGAPPARWGVAPEIVDPRRFAPPIDPGSIHQGVALLVAPLSWGGLEEACAPAEGAAPRVVLLDRVTDPQNAGAVLRSATVFGAHAVVAPARHSAPESGALAKAASGALERTPYLRVRNLARAMAELSDLGYALIGLDGAAETELTEAAREAAGRPAALALGAEGAGLRALTKETCDVLARIGPRGAFGSLNVSNAAAVGLYALGARGREQA